MPQYSRLSIWESAPHSMSWYDHVVGRKTPTKPFITPNTKVYTKASEEFAWAKDDDTTEFAYQDAWFKELQAQDRKRQVDQLVKTELDSRNRIAASAVHVNKKTLQSTPYFEYMFADAELEKSPSSAKNSIDDLSFGEQSNDDVCMTDSDHESGDDASLLDLQPGTPEPEFAEPHVVEVSAFSDDSSTEVSVSIELHSNDHLNENSTGSEPVRVSTGMDYLSEDKRANYGFFNTSGSFRHKGSARTNSQISQEDYFDMFDEWKKTKCTHSQLEEQQKEPQQKEILQPKSQKARLERLAKGLSKLSLAQEYKISDFEISTVVKKRSKQPSFEDFDDADDELDNLCHKKPRICLDDFDAKAADEQRVISACSGMSIDSLRNHKAKVSVPKGYVGQFDGMVVRSNHIADYKFNIRQSQLMNSGIHHTFGVRCHPNGLFAHTSITKDRQAGTLDFNDDNIHVAHPLVTCMNFATDMTIAASHDNIVQLRTEEQEKLRREAHIECTSARLEGVAIGQYRYYQGGLSIEEYHEHEMCIC